MARQKLNTSAIIKQCDDCNNFKFKRCISIESKQNNYFKVVKPHKIDEECPLQDCQIVKDRDWIFNMMECTDITRERCEKEIDYIIIVEKKK